ncbi:MAG: 16S rRNA (cytosine(1402)-N(4))-methyltransferase RsmH [Planctomycetaceae bacterium]|nr:16S rRNA (cytosine(1402)-N(4))-methyltransferase RsmH [Planctomycetaceae bacterium]
MNRSITKHRPVMLRETLQELALEPGLKIVDGTVGAGGHSLEVFPKIQPDGRLIGLDRDAEMLQRATATLQQLTEDNVLPQNILLEQSSYAELRSVLDAHEIESVDRILVDLGLSSDQLADRKRGFGFQSDGSLDMRFDTRQGEPIHIWLNKASIEEITSVLLQFGEDPLSPLIAETIAEHRRKKRIETVSQLTELIETVASGRGKRGGKSHPATRTFQALRIQANAELEHLKRFLSTTAPESLAPDGRLVVITFHSLEDRIVKQMFQDRSVWKSSSKKPIPACPLECKMNPRSRSAKIRIGIRAD